MVVKPGPLDHVLPDTEAVTFSRIYLQTTFYARGVIAAAFYNTPDTFFQMSSVPVNHQRPVQFLDKQTCKGTLLIDVRA